MKVLFLILATGFLLPMGVRASEDHHLQEACKAECPSAKSEHEAHECMKNVVKIKKNDRKFRKSDCYEILREHEKHENEKSHKE